MTHWPSPSERRGSATRVRWRHTDSGQAYQTSYTPLQDCRVKTDLVKRVLAPSQNSGGLALSLWANCCSSPPSIRHRQQGKSLHREVCEHVAPLNRPRGDMDDQERVAQDDLRPKWALPRGAGVVWKHSAHPVTLSSLALGKCLILINILTQSIRH